MPSPKSNANTGGIVIKSKLNLIIAQLEQKEGRRITDAEISRATGLSKPTVRYYRVPQPIDRIDGKVLIALCRWAQVENIGDLLYLDKSAS